MSKSKDSNQTLIGACQKIAETFRSNTPSVNLQKSEEVDLFANSIFRSELLHDSTVGAFVSEEEKGIVLGNPGGEFLVAIDPLDGSSNCEVNGNLGAIWLVMKRKFQNLPIEEADFFDPSQIVSAGFCHFGPRNVFVVADQNGVEEFFFDGAQKISIPFSPIPERGNVVSVNAANYRYWDKPVQNWMDTILEATTGATLRYSGCLVADFHRVLKKGGIFAYPIDRKNKNGKLRSLFECIPLSFIAEKLGGRSCDGVSGKSILESTPSSVHGKTGFVVGSKENIEDFFRG